MPSLGGVGEQTHDAHCIPFTGHLLVLQGFKLFALKFMNEGMVTACAIANAIDKAIPTVSAWEPCSAHGLGLTVVQPTDFAQMLAGIFAGIAKGIIGSMPKAAKQALFAMVEGIGAIVKGIKKAVENGKKRREERRFGHSVAVNHHP